METISAGVRSTGRATPTRIRATVARLDPRVGGRAFGIDSAVAEANLAVRLRIDAHLIGTQAIGYSAIRERFAGRFGLKGGAHSTRYPRCSITIISIPGQRASRLSDPETRRPARTHRWRVLKPRRLVLDPFCGCGHGACSREARSALDRHRRHPPVHRPDREAGCATPSRASRSRPTACRTTSPAPATSAARGPGTTPSSRSGRSA